MKKPQTFVDDPLTAIVRQGARDILVKALEMEIKVHPNFALLP
jgi:hypothetical protein